MDKISWFWEERVKEFVTNLYLAIALDQDNAKLILEKNISDIEWKDMGGLDVAKKGTWKAVQFLDRAATVSTSPAVFESQFLKPAKLASKFVIKSRERNNKKNTTNIEGYVFQKSDPFTDEYGTRVALSILFPDIGGIQSMRVSETMGNSVEPGKFYKFNGIKPIPFVNRCYQNHTREDWIEPSNRELDYNELEYIMLDTDDMTELHYSVCYENFCDIFTIQATKKNGERRGYVGAPILISGVISKVSGSTVTVRPINGSESITMTLGVDGLDLSKMKDKHVAILGSEWYRYSMDENSIPAIPEIFKVWEISESEAMKIVNEGRKRIEGKSQYFQKFSPAMTGGDLIREIFVDTSHEICKVRTLAHSEKTIYSFGKIFDPDALSEAKLTMHLSSQHGASRKLTLEKTCELYDAQGFIAKKEDIEEFAKSNPRVKRDFKWLRYANLVDTDAKNELFYVTNKGMKILEKLYSKEIQTECIEDSFGIIQLANNKSNFKMPSLVLKHLLEDDQVEEIDLGGYTCGLFWTRKNTTHDLNKQREEIANRIQDIGSDVLQEMTTQTNYAYSANQVCDRMRDEGHKYSYVEVNCTLQYLAAICEIVEQPCPSGGGNKWDASKVYIMLNRQKILFHLKKVNKFQSIDDIYRNIMTGQGMESEIKKDIAKECEDLTVNKQTCVLVTGAVIASNSYGKVSLYAINSDDSHEKIMEYFCQGIEKLAKKKKFWDREELIQRIRSLVKDSTKDSFKMANEIIDKMVSEGKWKDVEGDIKPVT